MKERKRKTTTSSAVKYRYNKKTYVQMRVGVRKEIASRFKFRLAKNGHTISSVFHKAIADYLAEHEKPENQT